MDKPNRAYLVDFDNTIFDTEQLKESISSDFANKFGSQNLSRFWKCYSEVCREKGCIDIKSIARRTRDAIRKGTVEDYENIFLKQNFKKFVFKKTELLIKTLKKSGKVILYTLGDNYYQPIKIKESGLEKAFGKKNIFIAKNKNNMLDIRILDLKSWGYSKIILIDDKAEVLEKAKMIDPEIITVWYRFGGYKNIRPKRDILIDRELNSQDELISYLENFVAKIKQNRLEDNVSVQKGIAKEMASQLIKLTAKDSKIIKFTHDKERFRSLSTFTRWSNRGKYIYTMSGRDGKLLGIVWFSKKQIPTKLSKKFGYTFAIRSYKPARGKGLSARFMQIVFNDFGVGAKKNIWLTTRKDNVIARKLYKNYGFKMLEAVGEDQLLYVFDR